MFSMPEPSEPTAADLAVIEAEWPLIEAELSVLDAEIALITTVRPSALDWRRLRRAEARLVRAVLDHTTTPTTTRRPALRRAA